MRWIKKIFQMKILFWFLLHHVLSTTQWDYSRRHIRIEYARTAPLRIHDIYVCAGVCACVVRTMFIAVYYLFTRSHRFWHFTLCFAYTKRTRRDNAEQQLHSNILQLCMHEYKHTDGIWLLENWFSSISIFWQQLIEVALQTYMQTLSYACTV